MVVEVEVVVVVVVVVVVFVMVAVVVVVGQTSSAPAAVDLFSLPFPISFLSFISITGSLSHNILFICIYIYIRIGQIPSIQVRPFYIPLFPSIFLLRCQCVRLFSSSLSFSPEYFSSTSLFFSPAPPSSYTVTSFFSSSVCYYYYY